MKCPACGQTARLVIRDGEVGRRNNADVAMNVVPRYRMCSDGHRTKTVELDSAELAELRRKAYLHELSQQRIAA